MEWIGGRHRFVNCFFHTLKSHAWYSPLILFVTLNCVILYIIWCATPPTQSHGKPVVKTDLYGAGWVDVSWSQFALLSHTHTHKLQVSCCSKENLNWKIFFVVVPYAPIYHIPIGLNNIFNNYYIYSHMIRSLLIEFGQARQDNIWSSATKLSQWIHNTLSTTVKERHLTFFTIHVIMDVCSKGFIAGAHLQKAKTMYWFRSFVFGNSHPPSPLLPSPFFQLCCLIAEKGKG